jgi:hypothetical protein
MSYRSLRIRPFKTPELCIVFAPRWCFLYQYPKRNHATNAPIHPKEYETGKGLHELENASKEFQEYTERRAVDHEVLSSPDEIYGQIEESSQGESPTSSAQPTFDATYSKTLECQSLFLPATGKSWGPELNHGDKLHAEGRIILRSIFANTALDRSRRRSRIIAPAGKIESKDRLTAFSKLLHPDRCLSIHWRCSFRLLFEHRQSGDGGKDRIPGFRLSSFAEEWFHQLCEDGDINTATERWQQLAYGHKCMRWPLIMQRCLAVSTEQALHFLLATFVEPFPPFQMVMDAMLYLKRARGGEISSSTQLKDQYMLVLSYQRQPTRWLRFMKRGHLDLLLEDYSADERRHLFEQLREEDVGLGYHCRLIFMDFFTRVGDVEMALKALNGMESERRLQPDQDLLPRCTNLLKLDSITYDGALPNFCILPRILEAGVTPNLILHNIIMKNAVKFGASAVAWDLYRYLQDHDLPTDAVTYQTLITDALARRDAALLDELMTVVHTREDLLRHPNLTVCIINVIEVIHAQESNMSPRMVFSQMLAVYSRVFSTAALKHLNMVDENTRSLSRNPIEPEAPTLAFVVRSYVVAQHSPVVVRSLLERIEHLRSEGDDLALALTQQLPLYDGFIKFFIRRSEAIPNCLQIIQSMLDRNIVPSTWTWSILASGFTKHGHFQAAEEVTNLINRQGLLHNEEASGTMTGRYAQGDQAGPAVVTLRNLEEIYKRISTNGENEFSDAGQRSQVGEQETLDTVDHVPSQVLHQRIGPNLQQPSGPNTVDGLGSEESARHFTEHTSGLNTARRAPTGSSKNQEQEEQVSDYEISNEPSIQRLHSSGRSAVHDCSINDSLQTDDLGQLLDQTKDLPPVSYHTVAATKIHNAQQLNTPNTGPLPQSFPILESNVAQNQNSSQHGLANVQRGLCLEGSDDTSRGVPGVPDLSLARLSLVNTRDSEWESRERENSVERTEIQSCDIVNQEEGSPNREGHDNSYEEWVSRDRVKEGMKTGKVRIKGIQRENLSKIVFVNLETKTRGAEKAMSKSKQTKGKQIKESMGKESHARKLKSKSMRFNAFQSIKTGFEGTKRAAPTIDSSGAPSVFRRDAARSKHFKTCQTSSLQDSRASQSLGHHLSADGRVRVNGGWRFRPLDLSSEHIEKAEGDGYDVEPGDKLMRKDTKFRNDLIYRCYTKFNAEAGVQNAGQAPLAPLMRHLLRTDRRMRVDGFWQFRPTDSSSEDTKRADNDGDDVEPGDKIVHKETKHSNDLIRRYYADFYADAGVENRGQDPLAFDKVGAVKQGTGSQA